jgi:hypothetical protein
MLTLTKNTSTIMVCGKDTIEGFNLKNSQSIVCLFLLCNCPAQLYVCNTHARVSDMHWHRSAVCVLNIIVFVLFSIL